MEREHAVVIWESGGETAPGVGMAAAIAQRFADLAIAPTVVPLTHRPPTHAELAAPLHVLSGGMTAVGSNQDWMVATRAAVDRLVRRAADGAVSVVGICLGAQLLAAAIAGTRVVISHPDGLQAGAVAGVSGDIAAFHYHMIDPELLTTAGATISLVGSVTPVLGFELGESVSGVQAHPELDVQQLAAMMTHHRALLAGHGISLDAAVDRLAPGQHRWDHDAFDRYVASPLGIGPALLEPVA